MIEIGEQPQEDTLLLVSEVAKRLRVDSTTVRRWIHDGTLAAVRLPASANRQNYRIRASTINALINRK